MPWIYAIVGLLVGTIVGVVISRLTTPEYKKQKAVQKELESAKFSIEQQRQELVDHFAQTAEMLDTLGKDYTKLYQHMAKTSCELLPNLPEQDNPFDKKTAMSTEQINEAQPEYSEQPKDYANGATGLLRTQEKEIINAPEVVTAKAS
ncbi:Z-ring associated protein ZapG [Vibrio mytili]|uniref:Z-ring associated protein G n=1 Tax=Vibrio mytili TaxID=50718 RepID=A0A0C3HMN7_9VIBR|nr:Z-ring associated protein ZapG [Vibrio mytili]KIN09411.1 membrane protein [Vibrio mytili]